MELPLEDFPLQFIETRTYILQTDNGFLSKIFSEIIDEVFLKCKKKKKPQRYRKVCCMNFIVKRFPLEELRDLIYEAKTVEIEFPNPFERDIFSISGSFHKYVKDHKPFTGIIIGKPCIEIPKLGRILATKLNSFYVDPISVLNNQMKQNRRIGQWIYANLVSGKKIPVDVLIKLIALELSKAKYYHYGYILGGLPTLPSFLFDKEVIPDLFENVPKMEVPKFSTKKESDLKLPKLDGEEEGGREEIFKDLKFSSSDIFESIHKGVKAIALEMEEEELLEEDEEEEYEPEMDDDEYYEMVCLDF